MFALVAILTIPAIIALKVKQLLPYQQGLGHRVSEKSAEAGSVPLPSTSVIVPARNEEAQIFWDPSLWPCYVGFE